MIPGVYDSDGKSNTMNVRVAIAKLLWRDACIFDSRHQKPSNGDMIQS
jgi:hypothetical protein